MKTIVFFLEEPSAREMLVGLLPKILPDGIQPRFLVFQGKQDLEKNLVAKMRGWQLPESVFVVMRDQDAGDCEIIKLRLCDLCRKADRSNAVVRVACRELESFYLGDLDAVEKGLSLTGLAKLQDTRKFRSPDKLGTPSAELERITKGVYQKVSGSRAIGRHLSPDSNRSHSFKVLVDGIRRLADVSEL